MTTKIQILLLSILLLPTISLAMVNIISPGSTLYASNTNQAWSSPNGTFSLGFIPINPPTSPPTFLAAIVYSGGIPIWFAGTIPVDSAAYLQLHPTEGNLRLVSGSGHTVWDSATANLGVSSASLDDYGNLVLTRNGTFPVWASFEHPTDTVVPGQKFSTRHVLRNGLYSFRLLSNGTVNLKWNDSTGYWSRGTINSSNNRTSPTLGLQPTGILSVSDPTLTRGAIVAYSNDYNQSGEIFRFLRLDSDGNLRIYGSDKGSGIQTVRWVAVEDQCRVFGYCGNMGICSYSGKNPICRCPSQNFELLDPKDSRKGCKRKVETVDCAGNLTMLTMEHTLFLTFPPQSLFNVEGSEIFMVGISSCRMSCLVNPTCDASTILSDGGGMCYYKMPGFISGYTNPALPSTSYVKVCSPAVPNASPSMRSDGWRMHAWALAMVVIGTILGLIALEGSLWWWCCRSSRKIGGLSLSAKYALIEYASGAPVEFSYRELRRLTKEFKEKLGSGGFGAVYRGVLADRTVVAVKRVEGIEEGERQFRMVVSTQSCTHHLNLVRLIGFCCERSHRLLVYEFMQNKSLDNFLFQTDDKPGKLLNWETRFNIALGTARGITYLHDECPDSIIHCDIKPENILLDENYSAKVSDFGLAKVATLKDHIDYLAPEWVQGNAAITSKSDVYSYGMVLLETVSGRRNMEVSAETNWKVLWAWAYEEFEKGNVVGIVDRRLGGQEVDVEQVMRAIKVSFWCIQEQPSERPRMGKVVHMLEGITEIHRPPPPKALNALLPTATILN